jgi:DNA repair exonuclease SbcCD nuclease subunit
MQVALRTLKHCISLALQKHQKVTVWLIGGNHDPHSSFAIAMCLNAFYENEPRVIVDLSPSAFKYMQFGKVLIGSHHGHGIKPESLPGILAADMPAEWGATAFRYWYVGHIHHIQRREFAGASVESFRTLAARDAWHSAKGYRAGRDMSLIVHHRDFGEIERHRADVAMLQGAA